MGPTFKSFPLIFAGYLFTAGSLLLHSAQTMAAGPQESGAQKSESADKLYEIQSGDTLLAIALNHGFSLDDLMLANGIKDADKVFAGQKLRFPIDSNHGKMTPKGVVLAVPKGFNLSRIATAYGIPIANIIRANKLSNPNRLVEGQELLIPGAKHVIELVPPPPCYKAPVTLYRVRNDVTRTVPLCFCSGAASPDGIQAISDISKPINTGADAPAARLLHSSLVAMVQKVAEQYPGKRIEVISGYRSARQRGNESNHNKGLALDFRVAGVNNEDLVTFLRTQENVGVGYYPNSVFVHLDIRDTHAYWIDYSAPGERAIYGRKGMTEQEIEKIRQHRQEQTPDSSSDETGENRDEVKTASAPTSAGVPKNKQSS